MQTPPPAESFLRKLSSTLHPPLKPLQQHACVNRTVAGPENRPLARARRRARRAKFAIVVGSGLTFAVATGLARSSYTSHPKRRATPLAAPASFVGVVRRNLLEAGAVAPPEAAPVTETSTS